MSYLNTPASAIQDFTKAVISLWFRVPQTSIDKCTAAFDANSDSDPLNPPHLLGIIPFVTFGKPQTAPVIAEQQVTYGDVWTIGYIKSDNSNGSVTVPIFSFTPTSIGNAYIDPSYIGVSIANGGNLQVVGNFQTSAIADVTGEWVVSGSTIDHSDGGVDGNTTTTWAESDVPRGPQAYTFSIDIADQGAFTGKWHHILVGVDLSNEVSATSDATAGTGGILSYNHIWVALDDVNYNGFDLFPQFFVNGGDPNAVVSRDAATVAGSATPPYVVGGSQIGTTVIPTGSIAPPAGTITGGGSTPNQNTFTATNPVLFTVPSGPVPINGFALGLPATADQVDHILNCEMAEFQMFTGVSLDTSAAGNRRAFIGADGKPVRYPAAAKLLGQKPDIAFVNTSQNWIIGRNIGKAGSAKPTGRIKTYFPSPRLGK